MKKIVLSILLVGLFGSLSFSQNEYDKVAKELCSCVNAEANGLSSDTKEAIIKSVKEGISLDVLFAEMAEKDPDRLLKDSEILQKIGEKIGECSSAIEQKYPELYATDDTTVVENLLTALSKSKSCEFTWALMMLGQQVEAEEGYYDEEGE